MELTARRDGTDAFVTVAGDMDVDTAYEVYQAVTEQAATAERVVLDLADVPFIDSVGISMLVRCRDELPRDNGCAFSLGQCSPQVTHLLELTGLRGHFSTFRPSQRGPTADLGVQPPKNAPVELTGYDAERDMILARRSGEPSFWGVQDMGDGYQAAGERGVDIVATQDVVDRLLASGAIAPYEVTLIQIIDEPPAGQYGATADFGDER